jgi:8-oxo-dGTP pyrophosphatase MutT (NUDIX family)
VKVKTKRVACCLIRDWKDDLLMGKRNDNGKFTQPGGHLDKGECPYLGCIRECKEETGLDAIDTKLVKVRKNGDVMVYVFEVKVDPDQLVDASKDPDKECDDWEYMDPNEVSDNLHVPVEHNIVLKYWMDS